MGNLNLIYQINMKLAILALIGAVFAEEEELTEKEKAAEDEVDEAIVNIEAGLEKIPADEKAAYDACMEGKTLPDKTSENTDHLLMLDTCYNVEGKEGWHCDGNRRECGTDMCCGKVTDSEGETVRNSC